MGAGQYLPKGEQHNLRERDRPHCPIEVPPLPTFTFGRATYSWQHPCDAQHQNYNEYGAINARIDLLHIPAASYNGDCQAKQIHQREIDRSVPAECVADPPIQRIRPILSKAKDVRTGFSSGQPPPQCRDTCADQNSRQPEEVPPVAPACKDVKSERTRRKEKDEDPNRPMRRAIECGVALANLALMGVFDATQRWHHPSTIKSVTSSQSAATLQEFGGQRGTRTPDILL